LRAYGYTRDELLACSVNDICRSRGPGGGLLTTPVSEGAPWTGTFRHCRKDGSTFEGDVTTIDVGDAEQPATMLLVQPQPGSDRA
jgi:hypothetical protein